MLRYIWVVLLVATAMAQETSMPTGFVYQISTARSKYIHGEEIVVTSILSNGSDRVQEVRVPHGFARSETCLLFSTNRNDNAESQMDRLDSDEQLMVRLVPGEAYTNSFSLAGLTTHPYSMAAMRGEEFALLPLGMWRITAIYHFESRTNDLYYDRVLRSKPLLIQVVKPEEKEIEAYNEFLKVLRVDKREERRDKLFNYINEHINGCFVRSAIREAKKTLEPEDYERHLVLARLDKQTAKSIMEHDVAAWGLGYYLSVLGHHKEKLELVDEAMVKRFISFRNWQDQRIKESGRNVGSGK